MRNFILYFITAIVLSLAVGCSNVSNMFKPQQSNIFVSAIELADLDKVVDSDLAKLELRLKGVDKSKYSGAELIELREALDSFEEARTRFVNAFKKGSDGKARLVNVLGFYTAYGKAKLAYVRVRPIIKAPDSMLLAIDKNFIAIDKHLTILYKQAGLSTDIDATSSVKLFMKTLDLILKAT